MGAWEGGPGGGSLHAADGLTAPGLEAGGARFGWAAEREQQSSPRTHFARPLAPAVLPAGGTAAGAYGSSQEVKDLLGGLFHYVAGEAGRERWV